MLSRNDMTVLMQQVDVGKALDLLTMCKEAGKEKIGIRTILDEAAPIIKDYASLVEKLEQLAGNHGTCNVSEFLAWMKVSRQTVYNWRDCGYLVYSGKKVNLEIPMHYFKEIEASEMIC